MQITTSQHGFTSQKTWIFSNAADKLQTSRTAVQRLGAVRRHCSPFCLKLRARHEQAPCLGQSRSSPCCMQPARSLPRSPACHISLFPSTPFLSSCFFKIHFNITLLCAPVFRCPYQNRVPIPLHPCTFCMRRPPILLYIIVWVMSGEKCRLWCFSLCSFLQCPVTSSLLDPIMSLSTLLSNSRNP